MVMIVDDDEDDEVAENEGEIFADISNWTKPSFQEQLNILSFLPVIQVTLL